MSEADFNISLGGGLYMDSKGDVYRGVTPTLPSYPLPGGGPLPITKEAFQKAVTGTTDAFKGTVKVLSDLGDPKSDINAVLTGLGISSQLLNLLGKFGEVAAKFAKVIPIVGAVVVVAEEFIKLFATAGPSPLELMIKAQFAQVHTHLDALEMQGKLDTIDARRVVISNAMTQLNGYVYESTKFQPSLAEIQRLHAEISMVRKDVATAVEFLLMDTRWLFSYKAGSFETTAPWLGGLLHVMPAGSPQPPPVPVPAVPAYQNRFEHGMMVPVVLHAVQSYLLLIKTIAPEYRSTGARAGELRKFATQLEKLSTNMRAQTLARTIYPVRSGWLGRRVDPWPDEVIDLKVFPAVLAQNYAGFPTGAVDLSTHSDAYFAQQRQAAIAAGADALYGPVSIGTLHFRWMPPAELERVLPPPPASLPETTPPLSLGTEYHITNLEECAAAANAQSEVDYAKLLVSSGYLNLVQLTTLVRHLATEPDHSETVQGDVILLRDPQPATDVTVTSDDIVFTGVIESAARREPARCRAIVPLSTQPLREGPMVSYRVVLRTLRSIHSPGHWHDPEYSEYYTTRYEKDPANPSFLRLATDTKDPWVLSEHELAAGTSPQDLVETKDQTATLTAHTFDWCVPVEPSPLEHEYFSDTLATLRAAGWSGAEGPPIPPTTMKVNTLKGPLATPSLTLRDGIELEETYLWRDGAQDWVGQRRELMESDVQIKYSLHWKADRLRIRLESRSEDRNYIVFLVVEETLPGTGQVLHTPLPVPMNGQLTYVPRKFFDDERAAIDRANRIIRDVETHYAQSVPVGPEDPFIGHVRPGDIYSAARLQRLADLAGQHQPALLRQAIQRTQASSGSVKRDVSHSRD